MPVKRRVPKRRVAELPDACFRYLAGLLEPGDEGSDEVIGFKYFSDPMSIEDAWRRYGAEATAAYRAVYPDSRPALWFRYGLPGDDGGGGGRAA